MKLCKNHKRCLKGRGAEASALPTYEGLPNLASFLVEFEEKVTESQRLSALDYVLKATPARWWGTHKQSISEWTQSRRIMEITFGEEISYADKKNIGLADPGKHIVHCCIVWEEYP